MLVISSVVIVPLNSRPRGLRRLTGMANIQHLLPTTLQNIFKDKGNQYQTERIILTERHFGNGGLHYIKI
jgi:hypothetical protein